MKQIALFVGKIISFFGGKLNRGSALPGKLAMEIKPDILSDFSLSPTTVLVTGTNGKTSTTKYISAIFKNAGFKVVTNYEGANMIQGIISTFLKHSDMKGKINADVLVLEVDEATLPKVLKYHRPKYIVMTNLFPDQEDRYGSVDKLRDLILKSIPDNTELILNGNDPRLVYIGQSLIKCDTAYYGVGNDDFDEPRHNEFCPVCGKELAYICHHYEHIGHFECSCGFRTPPLSFEAKNIDIDKGTFDIDDESFEIPYRNLYFIYNVIAAVSVAIKEGITYRVIKKTLSSTTIGKGRMDTIKIGEKTVPVNLSKNAAGFNQSISDIKRRMLTEFDLMIAANNKIADGVDTSWLDACRFDMIKNDRLKKIYACGSSAGEIKKMLLNKGFGEAQIVQTDISEALKQIENSDRNAYLLANYTALNDVFKCLNMEERA